MTSKVPSTVNSQNCFSTLMVTGKSSIEHEPQVQTPTNYHERIKFENTKLKKKQIPQYLNYCSNNRKLCEHAK